MSDSEGSEQESFQEDDSDVETDEDIPIEDAELKESLA